jgi:hypothetical protein
MGFSDLIPSFKTLLTDLLQYDSEANRNNSCQHYFPLYFLLNMGYGALGGATLHMTIANTSR